jgi:hypothetical protein
MALNGSGQAPGAAVGLFLPPQGGVPAKPEGGRSLSGL